MKPEWKTLARADDFSITGNAIEVEFGSKRKHRVDVFEGEDSTWCFRAIVAKPRALPESDGKLPWEMNRSSSLVGYRYDKHRRLVGESWVPQSADADEFQFIVRHLAGECDRNELRFTGADEH
jgi:hypothetical protein